MSKVRKIALASIMSAATATTLFSSTFAFVVLNKEAEVEKFDFNLETQTGLLISLDGQTFKQNITKDMIVDQIQKNTGKSYYDLEYTGVTLKHDSAGKIVKDALGNPIFEKDDLRKKDATTVYDVEDIKSFSIQNKTISITYYDGHTANVNFTKYSIDSTGQIKLDGISYGSIAKMVVRKTEKDSKNNFRIVYKDGSILEKSLDDLALSPYAIEGDNVYLVAKDSTKMLVGVIDNAEQDAYEHILKEASKSDYITFDLYFRVVGNDKDKPDYSLYFSDSKTAITGSEQSVELHNSMIGMTDTYSSGDIIKVNPQDAMRLGVINRSIGNGSMTIYEPTLGLGSSAIEGRTEADIEHYKEKNSMYTYYNSMFPLAKFEQAAVDGEGFNTINHTTYEKIENGVLEGQMFSYEKNVLGTFIYDEAKGDYPVIQLSVTIWMEGWDADYFTGIDATDLSIALGFQIK